MGLAGNLSKKAAKKVGTAAKNKVVSKVNGGCPGSNDGKHNYKSEVMKDRLTGKNGSRVTYCKNAGCGRTH